MVKRFGWMLLILEACSGKQQPTNIEEVSLGVTLMDNYPKRLSEWGLIENMSDFTALSESAFLYEINSPLFSDYALKARFIKLPEGGRMGYQSEEVLDFPNETVLIKHFYYPRDFNEPTEDQQILETRLLIKMENEWDALVYQWNEDKTDAERLVVGADVPIEWKDKNGKLQRINYSIPSQPQCKSCHEWNGKLMPIGPTARQLNKEGQLQAWSEQGLIELPNDQLPKMVNYSDESALVSARARAWLEINCAHCHRREGPAKNSGLYLQVSEKESYRIGVNKPPVAAGRGSGSLRYGIVPGQPEQSILVHRIATLELGEMMPELGRKLKHEEGIALIRQWIEEMD